MSILSFTYLFPFRYGKLITAVIEFIVRMTLYLVKGNCVFSRKSDQFFPKITVSDFSLRTVLPTVFDPLADPVLIESIYDISTV